MLASAKVASAEVGDLAGATAGRLDAAAPDPADCTEPVSARIGPNSVTQLQAALLDHHGSTMCRHVFEMAGQSERLADPPSRMVDEAVPRALFAALWNTLPGADAALIAAEAGRRTADYVMANRIPAPVRLLLKVLPKQLSAPLLVSAIEKNAWTFAGSGSVSARAGPTILIEIKDNPLAMPDCPWHGAVFDRLFGTLVAPVKSMEHARCCHRGDAVCRFELHL